MATGPRQDSNAEPSRTRADATRVRLVEAALEVFGERGYAAATTRGLAARAGVNLGAIPYHFGSKQDLYLAVAAHVAERIRERLAVQVSAALERAAQPDADRDSLMEQLGQLTDALVDLLLGSDEAEHWAAFIFREQSSPTAAFEAIYEGAMREVTRALAGLIGRLRGVAPDDTMVAMDVFGVLGQVMIFRTSRAAIQRRLGWKSYSAPRLRQIRTMVRQNTGRLLEPGQVAS